jgi:hypothetical protein
MGMKPLVAAGAGCLLAAFGVAVSDGVASDRVPAPAPAARPAATSAPVRPVGVHPVTPASRTGLSAHDALPAPATLLSNTELNGVVRRTCVTCHSDSRKAGNLTLGDFDIDKVAFSAPDVAEKMIGKLRAGMMPPPGRRRPGGDTMDVLTFSLERLMDARAKAEPNPGSRAFQRLNRAEYERSVQELLGLAVNAEAWLPLDTRSANFDNIADVQMPSATVLDAYLDAASEIARLAVGDPRATPASAAYRIPRLASQLERVAGAPPGTRGGTSVVHTFPADGEYVVVATLHATPTGQLYGASSPFDEQIEVSVDGERVALLEIDRGMSQADPAGMDIRTPPIPVRAGAHRVTAAFVRRFEGPVNDVITPIGHSIADTQIGLQHGVTIVPHLQTVTVMGPYNPTGVSETATRRRIFSCRPLAPEEAGPCAEQILTRLASVAYRRPATASDVASLMQFYRAGEKDGGFEVGVRTALEALLASPHFIFRLERVPETARPGSAVRVDQLDLASRLSFFLWGAPPDSQLIALARRGVLADTVVLERETRRLLKDPRSEALATRFAAQWLRLQDIDKVHPDALQFPDYHEQLGQAMRRETELFFWSLVRENRPVLELLTADYTYVNEALAKHYGIRGVVGPEFRRVQHVDSMRTGLFGHGSVLTLTSVANRTSPVLRGKWVMEVLLNSPPPPPPPVPDLEETAASVDGRFLTTRERMEMHRDNPSCASCHAFIDPIGLALDNFDVTGRWRIRENGVPLDTRGDFYDGTAVSTPLQLQRAMVNRPVPLLRAFSYNLMAYAIGRRVEWYDQPAIRRIEAAAGKQGHRINDYIVGVVKSDPFRLRRVPETAADANASAAPSSSRGR